MYINLLWRAGKGVSAVNFQIKSISYGCRSTVPTVIPPASPLQSWPPLPATNLCNCLPESFSEDIDISSAHKPGRLEVGGNEGPPCSSPSAVMIKISVECPSSFPPQVGQLGTPCSVTFPWVSPLSLSSIIHLYPIWQENLQGLPSQWTPCLTPLCSCFLFLFCSAYRSSKLFLFKFLSSVLLLGNPNQDNGCNLINSFKLE